MQFRKMLFVVLVLVLALTTSAPVTAAPNPAPLYTSNAEGVIRDRYIIVFQSSASDADVNDAADRVRGNSEVHYRYAAAIKGFAATLPAPAVEGLRRNPKVAYIEQDATVTIDTTQSPATWGLDRIDQRNLPLNNAFTYTSTGSGVTAYIIDTGIQISHQEFGGRASIGTDTVNDGRNGADCNGHGTHVAGTVGGSTYGVAKSVALVAVRVLNCQGSGTWSGVIAGIDWVAAHHAANSVANMSLGGNRSTAVNDAVNNAINSGVVFGVAAGNERTDACRKSPASTPAAITVGATTSSDARASYSNYGSCLDLFAPGSSITSAWIGSNTATNTISGTSMATPHVVGVAALYRAANPSATPAQVRNAIVANATSGMVSNPGRNSPNLLLFTNY